MKEFEFEYPSGVSLFYIRQNAEKIQLALRQAIRSCAPFSEDAIALQTLNNDLTVQLLPWRVYDVKCNNCRRMFKFKSKEPVAPEKIAEGGYCYQCDDDDDK